MVYELRFRKEAERDLEEIREHYDSILSSLTTKLFKEFFWTMQFIEMEPKLFQERYRGIRIAPMYRFPYGIHYKINGNRIVIYRVLNTKRYLNSNSHNLIRQLWLLQTTQIFYISSRNYIC